MLGVLLRVLRYLHVPEAELDVIVKAPTAFLGSLLILSLVVGCAIWGVMHWHYSERLAVLEERPKSCAESGPSRADEAEQLRGLQQPARGRRLTENQVSALTAAFPKPSGDGCLITVITEPGNQEERTYARDFARAFHAAGWNAEVTAPTSYGESEMDGLSLSARADDQIGHWYRHRAKPRRYCAMGPDRGT